MGVVIWSLSSEGACPFREIKYLYSTIFTMAKSKEILTNLPLDLKYYPQLWNREKDFESGRNITKYPIEIFNFEDSDDVRSIVIIIVGVILMFLVLILAKYSKEDI